MNPRNKKKENDVFACLNILQEMIVKNKKVYIAGTILVLFPFVLGFFGFLFAYEDPGYPFDEMDPFYSKRTYVIEHALFDAFGLFFYNRSNGGHINWAITISEFMAPICLFSGFFIFVGGFSKIVIEWFIGSFRNNIIAVYGDNENARTIVTNGYQVNHRTIFRDNRVMPAANKHIIFFRDEIESIHFYENNKNEWGNNEVFIVLDKLDPFTFKSIDKMRKVNFVNINEIVAVNYWLTYDLVKYASFDNMEIDIAIVGFGDLWEKILNYGIILNCYRVNQQIRYHVWGDTHLHENYYISLEDKINDDNNSQSGIRDSIIYEGDDYEGNIRKLENMDRIIIAEECSLSFIQKVITICTNSEIFFYDSRKTSLEHLYHTPDDKIDSTANEEDSIHSYGYNRVFSPEVILNEAKHRKAKRVNSRYDILYGELPDKEDNWDEWSDKRWNALTPFKQESNRMMAAYQTIREKILISDIKGEREITDDYVINLCKLEHVRWCRFHYLNAWEYDEIRDDNHRRHNDLRKFSELDEYEQRKDYEIIAALLADQYLHKDICQDEVDDSIEQYRSLIIRKISELKFSEYASHFWTEVFPKKFIYEDKSVFVAVMGYDITAIAFILESAVINCNFTFHVWGNNSCLKTIIADDEGFDVVYHLSEPINKDLIENADYVINFDGVDSGCIDEEESVWNRYYLNSKQERKDKLKET